MNKIYNYDLYSIYDIRHQFWRLIMSTAGGRTPNRSTTTKVAYIKHRSIIKMRK
jgi:hypothetical protein